MAVADTKNTGSSVAALRVAPPDARVVDLALTALHDSQKQSAIAWANENKGHPCAKLILELSVVH